MSVSQAELLARLPEHERLSILKSLTDREAEALEYDWKFWGRPEQQAPDGDWSMWLVLAGRGFGKTRAGSEWVRRQMCGATPFARGSAPMMALVAETAADARDVMVEGEAGILACHPAPFRPTYEPSKRRLTWPNGAIATLYNGTEPDQLRGPNVYAAWCDEIAKWRYAREAWDNLQFTLRGGDHPRVLITTTPRPIPLIRELLADSGSITTRGSTYDNAANLAPKFLERVRERYEGTRLGRQELLAELLEDIPGALWTRAVIDENRVRQAPEMKRVVVAVDPSGTSGTDDGDQIGIVVCGKGMDGRGYVLADRTAQLSPAAWGRRVVEAATEFGADRIVAERNFGGAMVEMVIRTAGYGSSCPAPIKLVTASRGKVARAEPIAALYEQCIAAGQMVETERGPVPIERIRIGDKVWTRAGLKSVLWAGQTGVRETIVVEHDEGQLECTPDHPVFCQRGFVNAGQLVPTEDMLLAWQSTNINASSAPLRFGSPIGGVDHVPPLSDGKHGRQSGRLWSLMAAAITSRQTGIGEHPGMAGMSFCTEPYGLRSIATFRTGGTFITLTEIAAITSWRIFRLSIQAFIRSIIMTLSGLPKAMWGLRFPTRSASGGAPSSLGIIPASSAAQVSKAEAIGSAFALRSAIPTTGMRRGSKGGLRPVYNLHVDGCHEFFAGGVLVHNCRVSHVGALPQLEDQLLSFTTDGYLGDRSPDRADAAIWGLTELMLNPTQPKAKASHY